MADDTKPRRGQNVTREQLAINRNAGVKYCCGCKETKLFEAFAGSKCRYDGLNPLCRDCAREARAKSAARKKEREAVARLFSEPRRCEGCGTVKAASCGLFRQARNTSPPQLIRHLFDERVPLILR
jgi:hypothetical protein